MHYANTKHTTQRDILTFQERSRPHVPRSACSSLFAAGAESVAEPAHSPRNHASLPPINTAINTRHTALPEKQKIPSLRHRLLFEASLSYKWLMLQTLPKRSKLSPIVVLHHTVLTVLPMISQTLTEGQICSYFVYAVRQTVSNH